MIKIINQKPGINSLFNEINNALSCGNYKTFRALVAYLSWEGIALIHEELEKFHDQGHKIYLIIGIGDDGSELDVLRYLKQRFSKAYMFVFYAPNKNYKFHPKVYIFDNERQSLFFIGSHNLTSGGLFSNSECCVEIEIDNHADKNLFDAINDLWNTYANPQTPFASGNLHKLNERLLRNYPEGVARNKKIYFNRFHKQIGQFFPNINIPHAPGSNLARQHFKTSNVVSSNKGNKKKSLLLQVLKETGANGTQVQIPREVIKNYFNVSSFGHQTIEVQIEGRMVRPAVICHFPNNTHRISFPEIAHLRRPLLMKFIHKGQKLYSIEFLKAARYKQEIYKCNNQTRNRAKKWQVF